MEGRSSCEVCSGFTMIRIKANHVHILSTYYILYTSTYIISFNHGRSPARKVIAPKTWRWDSGPFLPDPRAHSLSVSQVTSPRSSVCVQSTEGDRKTGDSDQNESWNHRKEPGRLPDLVSADTNTACKLHLLGLC